MTRDGNPLCRQIEIVLDFALLLYILSPSAPVFAQERKGESIAVTTHASRNTVYIGDKFVYTITVDADPEFTVKIPQFSENIGSFDIVDVAEAEPRKREGLLVYQRRYTLYSFTTGSHTIPAPVVFYTDAAGRKLEIEAEAVTVEVKSVLPADEEPQDIKDIPGPVELPVNNTPFLIRIVAGMLVIVGGAAAFLWLRRRKTFQEETVKKPPHVIAYEQLESLMASGLIEAGRIEEYYVSLSDAVRTYLENRFGLRAPEMTTEEFLAAAAKDSRLKDEHKKFLSRFLVHCDLVKFARYGPDVAEMKSAYESARQFVRESAPVETAL